MQDNKMLYKSHSEYLGDFGNSFFNSTKFTEKAEQLRLLSEIREITLCSVRPGRNMVKIGLQFKAELENLTNLRPEGEDFRWYIRLRCANCGEETKKFEYLTLTENAPLKGGRGHASMVIKCKLCSRENSIDIIPDSIQPYCADDSGRFKTIVVFDCRGVEPIDFSPRVGFVAEGEETGTGFSDISLTEGDWADYDEKKKESVGITEIEHKFIHVK